eukprot:XP_015573242.1 putative disease resistance protein RGA1 [Ricinus communis]
MADALLSALASTILTNLNSLVLGEFAAACGLRAELNNLESTFTTIQAVLHDAEEKQWKSESIKNWLRKLKDAAYEADDLLDEFAIQAQRRRLPKDLTTRVRSFFSLQNPVVFKVMMSYKLRNLKEKLDAIASERHKFHLREEAIRDIEVGSLDWRQTTSLVNESEIIGRDKEKEELINMLLTSSEDLSVYAICGMGGLGKTTLAQLVYNDTTVKRLFDMRIWVCVSDDFDLRRLTRAILESIEGCPPNCQEMDPLQRQLQERLSGKKFLLMLDDVWNESSDKWDGIKNMIRCGATGSVVTVTTRNENIALMMATTPTYYIGRLSDDDSWSLFEQRAFGLERKEEFLHLETIGRAIVNKCGGVPLAIKAMGSLMRLKRKKSEWLSVKESEMWELSNERNMNVLPALRLSYNHLAPHLKQCFAFCSIFPKDFHIKKEKLIELWMANGFIPCQGKMDLHDKGHEIFYELVWRSFLQDVEEDRLGNTTCKMHDLIHDLAQSMMIDECKLIEPNKVLHVPKMVRHLSICWDSEQSFPQSINLCKIHSLRSFLWIDYGYRDDQVSSYLFKQKHLRVLDLLNYHLQKLPMSIDRLKHLRYLDFSYSSIRTLPESTISLQILEILNLKHCYNLCKLPKGLKHIKNLVYLDITNCDSLSYMPAEMGKLTCLRKLSLFIVGKDNGCRMEELKELNLGGDLSIKKLDYVKSCEDAKNANLMQKEDLKSLSLCWSREGEDSSNLSEEVLDGCQPHSNLKKLSIRKYQGSKFASWMTDLSLPNLVEIELVDCDRCEHLPPFGELKFLEILVLRKINGVKCIGSEIYGNGKSSFPSLESLSLVSMDSLEEWEMVEGRDIFPVLASLIVNDCPKLVELPIIPSVKTLQVCWGSEILVRSIQKFNFIINLVFFGYRELTHLPDALLQNHLLLEDLQIGSMCGVKSLSNQLNKLSALKRLSLDTFEELESMPEGIWSLNSLETLDIRSCGVKSFPPINEIRGLSSLRQLSFQNCREFAVLSEGMRDLTTLQDLLINGCPKLNFLPESIGHLTALRELRIWHCEGLSSLPTQIGNLISLSLLKIWHCPNLMCLPHGISNLKNLNALEIKNCPNLKRRCQKDRGEDWPKIAHIPVIRIKD